MPDIAKKLRAEAAEATNWHGETMKQWDKIRALCAERDGSDLPRLMFEGLIDSLAELMVDGAVEIERLRDGAEAVCGWDWSAADNCIEALSDIEDLRKLLPLDDTAACSDVRARMKEPPREVTIVPNSVEAKSEVGG